MDERKFRAELDLSRKLMAVNVGICSIRPC